MKLFSEIVLCTRTLLRIIMGRLNKKLQKGPIKSKLENR